MRSASPVFCAFVWACSACAPLSDRIVLLPGPDGSGGGLTVVTAAGETLLTDPYGVIDVKGGESTQQVIKPERVQQIYGRLLGMQPMRPRVYVVYFESGRDTLTPASRDVLGGIRSALETFPAGEVVVIGHTDRVGSVDANDHLSLKRAEVVRALLIGTGVTREAITVSGRGEREPAVATDDEVPEPRNRRVEIKLR